VVAIPCCLCLRTVHALLRQGEGPLPREGGEQEGRKRLGQQPSHVTSGSARYKNVLQRIHDACKLILEQSGTSLSFYALWSEEECRDIVELSEKKKT
jgi:hypothetical protein